MLRSDSEPMGSESRGPVPHDNNPPEEDSDVDDDDDDAMSDGDDGGGDDKQDGGYDGDDDESDEYMTLEPEHPMTPESMTDLEKLLGSLRPRNSGSSAVGTPKWELQGTVDTMSAVRSVHDLPVHRQNQKKWILDRLD